MAWQRPSPGLVNSSGGSGGAGSGGCGVALKSISGWVDVI